MSPDLFVCRVCLQSLFAVSVLLIDLAWLHYRFSFAAEAFLRSRHCASREITDIHPDTV